MLKERFVLFLAMCCFAPLCFAQSVASPVDVVPITKEPSHHLVLENEYVRVFKVEVAQHGETQFHQHNLDYVFVTLGDSDVESVRVGEKPARLQLKDGETRFTKGGFAHKAVNLSDKPFVNLTVELKRHFDAEMRVCVEPMKCTREILVGGVPTGDTSSLFTNGFVTASRHHLLRGGTLNSSYYSARGKDRILFIPLNEVKVSFGGVEETLKAGQAYFSSAGEVEVSAGEQEIRWVVIRLNLPKDESQGTRITKQ